MKILRIRLENFQGIKEFEIHPDGKSCSVYGDNGAGKTTLYNAYCWLMYGKPSTEEKSFSPQTAGTHGLRHVVKMEIETDNGTRMVLRKDFHEVFKKSRGKMEKTASGRTSDYYVDDVPTKEKDFQNVLTALVQSDKIARMLTRYDYVLEEMPMAERRDLLMEMCGGVAQESVIAASTELEALPALIGSHSPEEYEAIAKSRKKEIGKELASYEPRIMEARRAKPDISSINEKGLRDVIEENERDLADYETRLASLPATMAGSIRQAVGEAEAEKAKAEAAYLADWNARNQAATERLTVLTADRVKAETDISILESQIDRKTRDIKQMRQERERLLAAYKAEAAKEFEGGGNCPTCGQPLPAKMEEEARKRFNVEKSERLEAIRADGNRVSAEVIELEEKKLKELSGEKEAAETAIKTLLEEIAEAKNRIQPAPPYSETEECRMHDEKIAALKQKLSDAAGTASEEAARLEGLKAQAKSLIQTARADLAKFDLARKQDERIAELEAEQRKTAAEYEDAEYALYLCGIYKQKQAELLESRINGMFETIQFRLFRELQKSGADGEKETVADCEALIPCGEKMVPFKSANNAARINAGLEMIDTLSRHYKVTMPIFIDNAESCTEIRQTEAQQIRLYVSEKDRVLRWENE